MAVLTTSRSSNRIILNDVSWETYKSLLKDFENKVSPRIAFDLGILEIMTPLPEHEDSSWLIAKIVEITLEEMDLDFMNLGHTTFKSERLTRGFEADACFYIQNVAHIRNKKRLDLEIDPPPDLIIEVDLTSDSLDKLPLYSALGIPEVWRCEASLEMMTLDAGLYVNQHASAALPILTPTFVMELMEASRSVNRPAWLRQIRQRIRKLM